MRDMTPPNVEAKTQACGPQMRAAIKAEEVLPALGALCAKGGAVAILSGAEGGFYRPVGAVMAVDPYGKITGQISAGCVDTDIAAHALEVMQSGAPKRLRYGQGSPFWDIRLPCGSGIDVDIFPASAIEALEDRTKEIKVRDLVHVAIGQSCFLEVHPDTQILVFGKGHEVDAFWELAQAAKFPVTLGDVFEPDFSQIDDATAVVFFFHDHAAEIELLLGILKTPAFWIGAQGSRNSQTRRHEALIANGVSEKDCARVLGPIGLIPKARNPHHLAISVLAEIAAAR